MRYNHKRADEYDISDWLETLNNLGIDTSSTFRSVYEAEALPNRIGQLRQRATSTSHTFAQSATAIVQQADKLTDAEIIEHATMAAFASDSDQRDRIGKFFDIASRAAEQKRVRAFMQHGPNLLHIIEPAHQRISTTILDTLGQIPDHVLNLQDAQAARVAPQLALLEDAVGEWHTLADLIGHWYSTGAIPGSKDNLDYTPIMFMVEDAQAYEAERVRRNATLPVARALRIGKPKLRTFDQIPEPPRADIVSMSQAQDEARYKKHQEELAAKTAKVQTKLPQRIR